MYKTIYFLKIHLAITAGILRVLFLVCMLCLVGCETIEVDEPNYQLTGVTVFEEDVTAEAAILGIYSNMMFTEGLFSGSFQSITTVTGLASDDLIDYSFDPTQRQFYENALLPSNPTLEFSLWNEGYQYIYHANAIIEGLEASTGVSEEVSVRLQGEAKFVRAFCYFHLVNLFGEIPLAKTTAYEVNSNLESSPVSEVYQFIENDLQEAYELLPEDYAVGGGERIRPNKWAATALKARVNLYTEQWDQAEQDASEVIEQELFDLPQDLNSVFLANSTEAIWQLKPILSGINTKEARMFILQFNPFHVSLSDRLAASFEPDDLRRTQWIDSLQSDQTYYYPFKYKVRFSPTLTEYSMVLRLAEQYLIRAEARLMQGDLEGSLEDLNTIRSRAGLDALEISDSSEIMSAILEERRHELFTERGHRWYDLKRTGKATQVLSPIKEQWQDTDVLFPIPENELRKNPKLDQNAGY